MDSHTFDPAVTAESGRIPRQERVTLPGEDHIEGTSQTHANGPTGVPGTERSDRRPSIGLDLLPTKRATHAQALHSHLIAANAQYPRHNFLSFTRVLRGRLNGNSAGF